MHELTGLQEKLLAQHRIDLSGEVNWQMVDTVRALLMRLSAAAVAPTVLIHITSPGGGSDAGLNIYDYIRVYPARTVGLAQEQANSMAAIILQACDVRLATPNARILIHHLVRREVKLDVLREKRQLKKMLEEMEVSQAKLYDILVRRTGRSLQEIKMVCKKDNCMSAAEAKDFGLIDAIIETSDEIKKYLVDSNY